MKWFQKTGNGKWIETDGPFSGFGIEEGIGYIGTILIIVVFALFIFHPIEFFEWICKAVYWVFDFCCNSKLLHSLDNLGNWG